METQSRLSSISPTLSEMFRRADDLRRRKALLSACLRAIDDAGLRDKSAGRAIEQIRAGVGSVHDLRSSLLALAQSLDDQYFALGDDERPTSPNALPIFQQARAASALALAVSADSTDWGEAIYEAVSASSDKPELIRLLIAELDGVV